MKKQNKTFAQRAREIESKYKRAKFDKLEKEDLEKELEALMQEQEAARTAMGLNEQPQQQTQQFAWGGFTPIFMQDLKNYQSAVPAVEESLSMNDVKPIVSNINMATERELMKDNNSPNFLETNKEYLPYAISGVSNIASNLLLAAMAKKNTPQVSASLATPEKMNLEPQAEQLRKDAVVSKNIGIRQARDLGLNAGATLANMGVIGSGVDRQLGANLTNLYGQQEQFNVGTANQFNLQNQEAINRANLINSQYQAQGNQDRLNYLSGALGTIPGVMKDIRMDKADKEMRGIMDAYYKSSGGKNYLAVGSIFDTEFGKYVVKGHNPDGTPITEKVKK